MTVPGEGSMARGLDQSGAYRPRRILITRLSAVGDCILTMPVACAIKRAFPDVLVGWLVQGGAASLVSGHPCVDRVIVVRRGWLQSPRAVWSVRRELRSIGFDSAVDPQSLTKSSAGAWLSGASRRIGFAVPQGRELSTRLNNILVSRTAEHVVDAYLQLLAPLGITAPRVEFRVPVDEQATHAIDRWMTTAGLEAPLAVVNPGAGWPSKLWPADRFSAVARHLGQSHHVRSVVVWAGEAERQWAREIVAGAGSHAVLAPPTTLPELAAIVRRARLFVGSDTGPLHLAAAVGTPCVGLYGPTRPADCGPYGAGHHAVQAYLQTGADRRRAANDAMCAISVKMVAAAVSRALEQTASQRVA